jgi:hypothetical protein
MVFDVELASVVAEAFALFIANVFQAKRRPAKKQKAA